MSDCETTFDEDDYCIFCLKKCDNNLRQMLEIEEEWMKIWMEWYYCKYCNCFAHSSCVKRNEYNLGKSLYYKCYRCSN